MKRKGLGVRFAEYADITAFPRLRWGCVQDKERAGLGSRCWVGSLASFANIVPLYLITGHSYTRFRRSRFFFPCHWLEFPYYIRLQHDRFEIQSDFKRKVTVRHWHFTTLCTNPGTRIKSFNSHSTFLKRKSTLPSSNK